MGQREERTQFEGLRLPKRCFISHSYKDAEAREQLLAHLPKSVEPFIFPPITAAPGQMISDKLLDAISACDGLIYLQGGASAESFWVALERDYALRQGKQVFAFTPMSNTLTPDSSPPLELHTFVDFENYKRHHRVVRRAQEMLRVRNFEVIDGHLESVAPQGPAKKGLTSDIKDGTRAGGYAVLFWSKQAQSSDWMTVQLIRGYWAAEHRILLALLDDTPIPEWARLMGVEAVQIYPDHERSMAQRIDDLIVRLYWLIYRNTRQNQLS